MIPKFQEFYVFLRAVYGNWRNAIFIRCQSCPQNLMCSGYLLAADAAGKPLLFSADTFYELTGERVDPSECSAILDRGAFKSAYAQFLEWYTTDNIVCPFSQLLQST